MCGIAGIYDNSLYPEQRRKLIGQMSQIMSHRGPDHAGIWIENEVAFAHNRLKIIDLSDSANQPFEYEDCVLTFNGEIYNYIELREQLIDEGYTFRTQSDTEVVIIAYHRWGIDCVKHFVGMWAFAIWDKVRRRMFCSRDRFGIKPFNYIFQSNRFYFASEVKALSSLPGFQKNLNIQNLNRALILGWPCYKDETNYEHIKALPASSNLVIEHDQVRIFRYWDLSDEPNGSANLPVEERRERFLDLFSGVVKVHSRSDVSLGGCLSGGIDSSSIASMHCHLFPEKQYKTFTIYYTGKDTVDERPFADEVARKYSQVEAHYFSPLDDDIARHYSMATFHADGPLLSSSYLSQYFVMKDARKNGVKVLLDGQGSDEYLLGYLHTFSRLIGADIRHLKPFPAMKMLMAHKNYHQLSISQTAQVLAKSLFMSQFGEGKVYEYEYNKFKPLLNGSMAKGAQVELLQKSRNMTDNFSYHLLFTTSLPALLHFEDRNSMAFSIESRVPFLDHRLVEYVYHLPAGDKILDTGETKSILRRALKDILPDAIANRKDKKAFVTPGEVLWLRGPLKHLLDIDYQLLYWLEPQSMKKMVADYKLGDNSNAKMVWKLAAMHYWIKHFA